MSMTPKQTESIMRGLTARTVRPQSFTDCSGTPVAAAEGVVEFGIAENFVAYGKDEAVWIYVFENGKSYRLTPERENTQFLGVSGGYVMWMDVTSRERDIIKYALPPL